MLTDTQLRKIAGKPWGGPRELADGQGLSARITPKGAIAFQYRYRRAGRARRMTLGAYPRMSLKAARAALVDAKALLDRGIDPADHARLERRQAEGRMTVARLLDEWCEVVGAGLVKGDYWRRQFDTHICPHVGRFCFEDLGFDDWEPVFVRLVRGGSGYQAGHLLKRMQYVAEWGRRTRRVGFSELSDIRIEDIGAVGYQEGERALGWVELKTVWGNIEASRMAYSNKIFMRLAMLLLPRTVELVHAQWDHWDIPGRVWEVPKEYIKGRRRAVRRPIPEFALPWLEMLREINPGFRYLFPPPRGGGGVRDRPMSASVPLAWPRTVGGDLPLWTMHDFRRSGATRMAEMGIEPYVAEKLLGHRMQGTMAIYNRHDYIDDQLRAIEAYYHRIVGG